MSEKALDKIKKLLKLAKSNNPNEAATAMRMAQKMMQEHQLSEQDVALSAIGMQDAKDVSAANKPPAWASLLAGTICQIFGLDVIRDYKGQMVRTFIGPNDRVQIGAYCYEVLGRQLLKARAEFSASQRKTLKKTTKTNRADLFAEGWIRGVRHKITALVPTEQEQELIQLYIEQQYPELSTSQSRSAKLKKRDLGGFFEGVKAGSEVELNAGVTGAGQSRISHTNLGLTQ